LIESASPTFLATLLAMLLLVSAFFSGSETALLTLNRYRLRHRAREGHLGARLAEKLLARPDRLISLILIGSNIANTLASSLVTLIALQIGGPGGVALASVALAFVIMLFTDVIPKTLGAVRSDQLGPVAAIVYYGLLKVALPIVWFITLISNGLLALVGVRGDQPDHQHLTLDELRTIVTETGAKLPRRRQRMLLSILELEDMTVDEIMIPDNELVGLDLDEDWPTALEIIRNEPHSRFPVFRGSIENLVGLLHVRSLVQLGGGTPEVGAVESLLTEPFFIPEGTSVHGLLVQFQRSGQRTAFVVDEYGDIQGMVTIENILEEILGEFTSQASVDEPTVRPAPDGAGFLVDAGINVRDLNRSMGWKLPTDGPTTLNGLILEQLETIPAPGTTLLVAGYAIEIIDLADNAVNAVRIRPAPEVPPALAEP
jgi:Mg2+/Co2+ transporter CorB